MLSSSHTTGCCCYYYYYYYHYHLHGYKDCCLIANSSTETRITYTHPFHYTTLPRFILTPLLLLRGFYYTRRYDPCMGVLIACLHFIVHRHLPQPKANEPVTAFHFFPFLQPTDRPTDRPNLLLLLLPVSSSYRATHRCRFIFFFSFLSFFLCFSSRTITALLCVLHLQFFLFSFIY